MLLGTWWGLKLWTAPTPPVARTSILARDIDEPEFASGASAEKLLALAEREVESLLVDFPNSAAALNVKANRNYLVSDTQAARQAWQAVLAIDPRNADALFGIAMLAFESGEYDEAAAISESLLRSSPGNPRVPLLLADAYLHAGKPQPAVFALEQHISTEATSVQALEMLGNAHLNAGNKEKAIACFERAIQNAPDSKDAYYGLGQAYARLGEREKAAEYMQQFENLARSTGQSHAADAQAFEDIDFAAHVAAQTYVDAALIYATAGKLEIAQEKLLRALKLQPDVVSWLEELQRVFQQTSKLWEAIDVGERLVHLQPERADHWLTLGGLYAEVDQPEPAVSAFRKAIELAPNDPRCLRAESIIRQLQ